MKKIAILIISIMVLALAGCGGGGSDSGTAASGPQGVSLNIVWPAKKTSSGSAFAAIPPEVLRVVLKIKADDMSTFSQDLPLEQSSVTITVPDGAGRMFNVCGYPDAMTNIPNYYGFLTVPVSGNTVVTVYMQPVVSLPCVECQDTSSPQFAPLVQMLMASLSGMEISWIDENTVGEVSGYKVYRDGVPIATTTSTFYIDIGYDPNTSHTYKVTAYDAAGNQSASSTEFSTAIQLAQFWNPHNGDIYQYSGGAGGLTKQYTSSTTPVPPMAGVSCWDDFITGPYTNHSYGAFNAGTGNWDNYGGQDGAVNRYVETNSYFPGVILMGKQYSQTFTRNFYSAMFSWITLGKTDSVARTFSIDAIEPLLVGSTTYTTYRMALSDIATTTFVDLAYFSPSPGTPSNSTYWMVKDIGNVRMIDNGVTYTLTNATVNGVPIVP